MWESVPDGLKAKVAYQPRYRPDTTHTGRFKPQKPSSPHSQTVTAGLVSLQRINIQCSHRNNKPASKY